MGIESRRQQLIEKQPNWGDRVQRRGASRGPGRDASRVTDAPINSPDADSDERDERDSLIMVDPESRKRTGVSKISIPSCQGWSLQSLLSESKNFHPVPRVSWSPTVSTEDQIRQHEAANPAGVPLVVEGLHQHPKWMHDKFSATWFEENGPPEITVRNVHDRVDRTVKLSDFMSRAREASAFATREETERLYGKDVPCPSQYNDFLHAGEVIPSYLAPDSPENLLNALPLEERAETLMCYIGIGDTFTPCHKDLCASSGHNLMCYTANGGSSFWFMTETSSAHAAAEYFSKKLGYELDHENHVVTFKELARAPFKVYITEQKLGDLVLVPPRSCHQVVNAGGITLKTSWSRMTLDGLSLALRYELPLYRRVCRSEIYRVKSTIHNALLQTTQRVSNLLGKQAKDVPGARSATASSSQEDMSTLLVKLRRLIDLFDSILVEEYSRPAQKMVIVPVSADEDEPQFTCDFCGGDIFQSFFECRSCVDGEIADYGSGFVICPGCYVEGRTCRCEVMAPMQRRPFEELLKARGRAVDFFNARSELQHRPDGPCIPSEEQLLGPGNGHIGLFRAAVLLRKTRREIAKVQKQEELRSCTTFRAIKHRAPNAWVLPCKKCHHSACFAHLVSERHLHSAEALLVQRQDDEHKAFHDCHRTTEERFKRELPALQAEKLDQTPHLGAQLAHLANTFTTCRPVGYSKYRKGGFYDLIVWENESPSHQSSMAPAKIRRKSSIATPVSENSAPVETVADPKPKRQVMDCVQVPVYRLPKRKERRLNSLSSTETSSPRSQDEADVVDNDSPPRKKSKRTHERKGPPGIRDPPSVKRKSRSAVESRPAKKVVIEITEDSDSDERPPKKPRSAPQSIANLRFKKVEQTAMSVADAFNNASAQNHQSVLNAGAPLLPTIPPPPRSGKRRRRPEQISPDSSSPDGGSEANATAAALADVREIRRLLIQRQETMDAMRRGTSSLAPPSLLSRRLERSASSSDAQQGARTANPLEDLTREIAEVKEMQAQQDTEMDLLCQAQQSNTREALDHTGDSMKGLVDLVSNLVSSVILPALQTQAVHAEPPAEPPQRPRNWLPRRGMRGRAASFGETNRRIYHPGSHHHEYRASRQYYDPVPSYVPNGRHVDVHDRVWQPGPYAEERLASVSGQQRMRHRTQMDHDPETHAPRRSRRSRFSPPSPDNRLALVPISGRRTRSLSRPPSHADGLESSSEATVTNTEEPAANATDLGGQSPLQPNCMPTQRSFFVNLRQSVGPPDEQDWEAGYANGGSAA